MIEWGIEKKEEGPKIEETLRSLVHYKEEQTIAENSVVLFNHFALALMKYSKLDIDLSHLEMIFDKMVEIHLPISSQNMTNFLVFIFKLK